MKMTTINSIKTSIRAIILSICLTGQNIFAQTLPLTPNLIGFDTPEGEKLLIHSK